MKLEFEVLLDEPHIGRIVRGGNWILTTFPDGHGEWDYWPVREISGKPLQKCQKHPKAVWFDGYLAGCPLCKLEAENDFSRLTEGM